MNSETVENLEDCDNFEEGADFKINELEDEEEIFSKYHTLGRCGRIQMAEMEATKSSLKDASWLDQSPNGLPYINKVPFESEIFQVAQKWKTVVSDLRQEVLADRSKNIPINQNQNKNKNKNNKYPDDPNENNVAIVNQSYLLHDFKAQSKAAQKLIEEMIEKFSLNTEQERAFRIVANHASDSESEQLKMYLKGMGETGKTRVIKALMN